MPEAFGEGEQFLKNMRESEGELSMGNLQVFFEKKVFSIF